MKMPRTRDLMTGFVIVLAVGTLVVLYWPRPTEADAAAVSLGPIAETVADQGVARVRQAYVVSSPVGGRLERITLEVGDHVAAGETVVARVQPADPPLLDPRVHTQAESAVQAARAALAGAVAERDQAAVDVTRTHDNARHVAELERAGAAARQDLDDATAAADRADAALRAAEANVLTRTANVKSAEAELAGPRGGAARDVPVTSPASGVVTRVVQQSERTVAAGTPLIEVGDTVGLEAEIEFLSQDAVRIRPGQRAEIYDWGGPGRIAAEVRRVEPQGFTKVSALGVEEQRTLVMLQFTGPAADWTGLAPGYRVWGRVFLRELPSATLAPLGALVRSDPGWAVYRIEQGRARLRPVQVGILTDEAAEILSGVAPGDRVIVYPSDVVHDGLRVRER